MSSVEESTAIGNGVAVGVSIKDGERARLEGKIDRGRLRAKKGRYGLNPRKGDAGILEAKEDMTIIGF